jgi:8-oxo-dGTP diphosphatase
LLGVCYDGQRLRVLLIERAAEPFAGHWALPGGFVHIDESVDAAALRELEEETGVTRLYLEQLYTFGELGRDPRERVVTVAYYALVKLADHAVRAATDAKRAEWFAIEELPELAFDHDRITSTALERLRAKIRYRPVGFELLAKKFTLTELQRLYEAVLGRELDKRNFRKKILAMDLLEELDEFEQSVARRAARLYRFDERKYKKLARDGFEFSL